MKLGIDASNIRAGGGIVYLKNLLMHADPKSHDFKKIFVYGGIKTLENLPQNDWLELREIRILNRSFAYRLLWQGYHLGKFAEQEKALLFVPGGLYLGKHRPFVSMFQNMQIFETAEKNREGLSREWVRLQLLQFGQMLTFRNCAGLICLSDYALNYLQQFYPKLLKNIEIRKINHGISQTKQQSREYLFKQRIKLLYVSTVKQYKHQWHLIEAVAQLEEQGFPLELHLIGSGDRPALKRMHKAIKETNLQGEFVYYHGGLSHLETLEWYKKVDIFAYPSSCENLPNILLEAMAAGLPIACSDRGPMPELLRDAGVYFNPEQPDSIASSLKLLLEDKLLRKTLGSKALSLSKVYSWERCAKETFSFLSLVHRHYCL